MSQKFCDIFTSHSENNMASWPSLANYSGFTLCLQEMVIACSVGMLRSVETSRKCGRGPLVSRPTMGMETVRMEMTHPTCVQVGLILRRCQGIFLVKNLPFYIYHSSVDSQACPYPCDRQAREALFKSIRPEICCYG